MPHASLLVMTSPLLLGPLPSAAMVETSAAAPHIAAIEIAGGFRPDLGDGHAPTVLPLNWSLQSQDDHNVGPQDDADTPQSGSEPPNDVGGTDGQSENEIVVDGTYGPPEGDPMGVFNETSYRITQDLDEVFVEPVAYAYRDGLPGPLRDGLGNVVRNLGEPANFLNFLLQFKIGKAVETLGRFAINSTLGMGGLFDIAGEPGVGLPYRRNGFANTLGFYGVDTGAYLYLPITGATTVRDLIGNSLDQAVLPFAFGAPFDRIEYAAPYFVISNLDARLEVDAELEVLDSTIDPYSARRDTYLARRARDIALLRGEEPPAAPAILEELEEELECGPDGCAEDDFEDGASDPDPAPAIAARQLPAIAEVVNITQPTTR
ncbi:MlaA family lipoprotein [Erythrobacter sp. Alg231-14]|uniref:MlaA family lipoprotein n=1 Tax=Erythrobacter sp. Alg231-14 TaxID=1922225 RepID=UPI000D54C5DB